jgi:serine/threonine protein kinase
MAGVAHMFRHRLLHLDLKPDNVMLSGGDGAEGRLVIVDFGLAMRGDRGLRPRHAALPHARRAPAARPRAPGRRAH